MDANTAVQQGTPQGAQGLAGGPPAGGRPPGGAGGAMMFLGPYGSIVTFGLLILTYVVLAIVFWQFLKKIGLTPTVALLMLVPVVNLGVALWAVFTEWPVTKEIARLKLVAASVDQGTAGLGDPTHSVGPIPGTIPAG